MRSKLTCLFLLLALTLPTSLLAADVGEPAPDFKLPDLAGKEVALSQFRGQLVLLKLATTWCHTCKELTAELLEIGDFLQQQDVVLIDVFVQDSTAMVERYLADKKFPMAYHALLDDGQAYRAYNIYLIPRLLLIDRDMKVRFDTTGRVVSAKELKDEITKLQPAKPAAAGG